MDIWFLLMRDVLLMDSFDHPSTSTLRLSVLGSTPILADAAGQPRKARGCDNVLPSQQTGCELDSDLLETGWTDPGQSAAAPFVEASWSPQANDAYLRTFGDGVLVSDVMKFASAPTSLEPSDAFDGLVSPAPTSPEPDFAPFAPSVGAFPTGTDVTTSFTPSFTVPASVPEPPITVMLLIGAAALSLAATLKASRGRPLAGS